MLYSKKYPITQLSQEFLILEWERGYNNMVIYHNDREICTIDSIQKIKKGFSFIDNKLGVIELRLSEKPITIDIIVNGLHSSVNNSHPAKKIKALSMYFFMFATFSFLYCLFTFISARSLSLLIINLIFEVPFIILYIICGIQVRKSKTWAVYTGFIVFCFFTFITLISIVLPFAMNSVFLSVLMLLFKIVFIIFMVPFVKSAGELSKYKNFKQISNQTIIDDI